jgi:predicted DCC family thiol-disulfide oxidoreductase YuxK
MQPKPAARVIVFDGMCHVCTGGVRFVRWLRVDPPFQLIPMQSVAGRAILVDHGIDPEDPTTFLVLDQGERYTESEASIHVIAALGGLWRVVHIARLVPRSWRDALYRLLARNRYRWFGRRGACYLPQ